MAVPSSLSDLSTTAASNSPAGSESIGTSLDDYLRSIQAIIKQGVSKGSDIASASTITPVATSSYFIVTGTTGITAIGETYSWTGRVVVLKFDNTLTLTHSSGLILPGAANISTAAGHVASFVNESTGVWRCVQYNNGIAPESANAVNDFRLTLTTGVPVTTTDVTGATTIYCAPYKGNRISLFDGSKWNIRSSAEFSLALGTLTSGKPYDVFCYDNAGVPTLEFLVWTNDTTRATALAYQDGVLVKSGAATRRYLGTFYTTSTTATEDSVARRYLWNYYNRVSRKMYRTESTASWTYNSATFRQANANTANQLNFVIGVAEDAVNCFVTATGNSTAAAIFGAYVAIGLDSTTTPASESAVGSWYNGSNWGGGATGTAILIPSAGRHYAAWLEASPSTNTITFYASFSGVVSSAINGSIMA